MEHFYRSGEGMREKNIDCSLCWRLKESFTENAMSLSHFPTPNRCSLLGERGDWASFWSQSNRRADCLQCHPSVSLLPHPRAPVLPAQPEQKVEGAGVGRWTQGSSGASIHLPPPAKSGKTPAPSFLSFPPPPPILPLFLQTAWGTGLGSISPASIACRDCKSYLRCSALNWTHSVFSILFPEMSDPY